jgi:hypothetical protein
VTLCQPAVPLVAVSVGYDIEHDEFYQNEASVVAIRTQVEREQAVTHALVVMGGDVVEADYWSHGDELVLWERDKLPITDSKIVEMRDMAKRKREREKAERDNPKPKPKPKAVPALHERQRIVPKKAHD